MLNSSFSHSDRVIRHLASWGLGGRLGEPIASDGIDPTEIGRLAAHHRISGVALAAIDGGALTLGDRVDVLRSRLGESELRLLRQALAAEADLVRVARVLDERNVDFRVLKGLATAHLDHIDPALRITSDVDLLVRPDQLMTATKFLRPLIDQARTEPDRRWRHTERYGKDRTLRLKSGGWLDLHRMIAPAYWGLSLDHSRLFDDADSYRIAGGEMNALSRENRFVHSVLHAGYTSEIKLQSFRDVAVLAATLGPESVDVLSQRWLRSVRGLLALGIVRANSLLGLPRSLTSWALSARPSGRETMALLSLRLGGNREHWSGSLALAPWKWPGYLAPIAYPSRDYLSWSGRSRFEHLTSARRALRRRSQQC